MDAPRPYVVKGTIELTNGAIHEFQISRPEGWTQWGAGTEQLGHTVALLDAMSDAAADHLEEALEA